jgi:lysophospholipase L1-like esterase
MTCKFALSFVFVFASGAQAASRTHWVVTWGASASPQLEDAQMRSENFTYADQTLREIVHASAGGEMVRVRLSNAYGKQAVEIRAGHLALSGSRDSIQPGSDHVLTFSGRKGVSIPPNGAVVSDAVKLDLPPGRDVTISLYFPKSTIGAGIHYAAQQTAYIGQGDVTGSDSIPGAKTLTSWVFLNDLDVTASGGASTLIAFGDSITDGAHSTVDANHRWPNFLAERLRDERKHTSIGILDAGIGGNRILHDASRNVRFGVNALARFDRDVLAQPGAKYVIVLEGINDLGHAGTSAPASETVSAEDIIAGLGQLAERAHENGVKILCGTLTPFEGAGGGYFTPEKEEKRKAVNEWVRSNHTFDGAIDFDKAVRDPNHPERMLAEYDSGDHLHPADAGYKAMAAAVDLRMFR